MPSEYERMSRLKLIKNCILKDGIIIELETANADLEHEITKAHNKFNELQLKKEVKQ